MKYDQLVKEITEYESDTFTASGFSLTNKEAHKLAERCINYFVNNDLDGCKLDIWLAELRGER